MQTLKQLLHNLRGNEWYVIIGAVTTAIGYNLLTNEHFFFWPPQYSSLMNDDRLDAITLCIGLGLIIYSAVGKHVNSVISVLLGLATANYTVIAVILWIHMQFAGQCKFNLPLALCIGWILVILKVAKSRNIRR